MGEVILRGKMIAINTVLTEKSKKMENQDGVE